MSYLVATPLPEKGIGKFVLIGTDRGIELHAKLRSDSSILHSTAAELETACKNFTAKDPAEEDRKRIRKLFGMHAEIVPGFERPYFGGGLLAVHEKTVWWGGHSEAFGGVEASMMEACLASAGYTAIKI